ncbi:uncharacterized protein N7482_001271 [Penicillium canariense]|uniref:SREBP regulating gene protein n=1 Tax=Penicillium canariense TaxID=189055 RepID=A0A9W9IFQ3_9EURO|nr:uncharacterized protein N7482_001271 [Penicillium canariense]KAJ5175394.1 hypothetical protein N7482_001271 [Penicillium canariense]
MLLQLLSFPFLHLLSRQLVATSVYRNEGNIRLGCFDECKDGFNPSSTEYQVCRDQCTKFDVQDHCCTSSCSSISNVCLNDYFHRVGLIKHGSSEEEAFHRSQLDVIRENPGPLDKRAFLAGDAPYHLIRITETLLSLNPQDFKETFVDDVSEEGGLGTLDRRVDNGKALQEPALQNDEWNDEGYAGLVLVSFGIAGAWTCNLVYNVQCVFFKARTAP